MLAIIVRPFVRLICHPNLPRPSITNFSVDERLPFMRRAWINFVACVQSDHVSGLPHKFVKIQQATWRKHVHETGLSFRRQFIVVGFTTQRDLIGCNENIERNSNSLFLPESFFTHVANSNVEILPPVVQLSNVYNT